MIRASGTRPTTSQGGQEPAHHLFPGQWTPPPHQERHSPRDCKHLRAASQSHLHPNMTNKVGSHPQNLLSFHGISHPSIKRTGLEFLAVPPGNVASCSPEVAGEMFPPEAAWPRSPSRPLWTLTLAPAAARGPLAVLWGQMRVCRGFLL